MARLVVLAANVDRPADGVQVGGGAPLSTPFKADFRGRSSAVTLCLYARRMPKAIRGATNRGKFPLQQHLVRKNRNVCLGL
jgi:hypothetical protein